MNRMNAILGRRGEIGSGDCGAFTLALPRLPWFASQPLWWASCYALPAPSGREGITSPNKNVPLPAALVTAETNTFVFVLTTYCLYSGLLLSLKGLPEDLFPFFAGSPQILTIFKDPAEATLCKIKLDCPQSRHVLSVLFCNLSWQRTSLRDTVLLFLLFFFPSLAPHPPLFLFVEIQDLAL